MSTYSVIIKLKGNLAKANRKAVVDVHRAAITQQMDKAVDVTYREVKKYTPEGASKNLIQAISKEVINFPSYIQGRVFIKEGLSRKYAKSVEFGTKKYTRLPTKGSLILWLIVKLGMSLEEAKNREWFFRRSIFLKGIEPVLMFFKGFYYSNDRVRRAFRDTGKVIKEKLANART